MMVDTKNNASNTKPLLYLAFAIIVVLLLYILLGQSHNPTSTVTTIITTQNTTALSTSIPQAQPVQNPSSYKGQASVVFSQSTTLTGDIVTSGNITVLLRGVVINTNGYSLISGGTFDNQGSIATGLAGNSGENASYSYGGSGGGGWAFGCGNAGGGSTANNGGSTVVAGGSGLNNGFNQAAGNGASGSSPSPTLNNLDIQTMYSNGMQKYLEGAGGGSATNCDSTETGGSGSYGVYIQANKVMAGVIGTGGQAGSGANEEASGGGGGGAILISYGLGGYISGSYNFGGGTAGIGNYGKAGSGGSGGLIAYNYSSSPPIAP